MNTLKIDGNDYARWIIAETRRQRDCLLLEDDHPALKYAAWMEALLANGEHEMVVSVAELVHAHTHKYSHSEEWATLRRAFDDMPSSVAMAVLYKSQRDQQTESN